MRFCSLVIFFKAALDAGKVDGAALFPGGKRAPVIHQQSAPDEVMEEAGDLEEEGASAPEPARPESGELADPDAAAIEAEARAQRAADAEARAQRQVTPQRVPDTVRTVPDLLDEPAPAPQN